MKPKKGKRNKTLAVSITAEEKAALQEDFRNTNQRVFSDYIRALLKREPVVRKYRNQSLEDLHLTVIGIKAELEEVCRNFARGVERLKGLRAGVGMAGLAAEAGAVEGVIGATATGERAAVEGTGARATSTGAMEGATPEVEGATPVVVGATAEVVALLVEEELALKAEVMIIKSTLIKLYEKCLQESDLSQR